MNIYAKLQAARLEFQALKMVKTGKNAFSGYSYFELADFMPSVNKLFSEHQLCGIVSFSATTATLTIVDTEHPEENIVFASPMSSCALKGCHEVQNLGAVQTYLRRYLYILAFEVIERDTVEDTSRGNKDENVFDHDPAIISSLETATTLGELSTVWMAIPVGIRKEYTAAKDSAKLRLGGK